jgi:hypothetical protein
MPAAAPRCRVDVVLIHHPVRDRTGELVTTSVTNLDVHDIARASRTYGVRAYHVVTPIELQRDLVRGVADHWLKGGSGERVPERAAALRLVRVAASVDDAWRAIEAEEGAAPLIVMTTANARSRPTTPYADLRARIASGSRPVALCFGTGWGLAAEVLDRADVLLEPIMAASDYNHLSVRVAVGVALDRLLGDR